MGTRNLTMVVSNNKTKVAQYGQWDGYPSGQGLTILEFLLGVNQKKFKTKVDKLRFATDTDTKEVDDFLASIGCADGWMSMEQSAKYQERYKHLSRDAGGKVLDAIMYGKITDTDFRTQKKVVTKCDVKFLNDSSDFAGDFSCEWAYVIDLDKRTFEVYKGYNQKPLAKTQRFYPLQTDKSEYGYYPIKKVKSFSLDALPSVAEWKKVFKIKD